MADNLDKVTLPSQIQLKTIMPKSSTPSPLEDPKEKKGATICLLLPVMSS